jgi:OOP family OmpA-OmpF porin
MNKNMWLSVVAAAGLALSAVSFQALGAAHEKMMKSGDGEWANSASTVWKNGSGECWQAGYWTPAMATEQCGADMKKPMAPKAPAPAAKPRPRPVANKVTLAADVLFDFDKSVIKASGRTQLDSLASQISGLNLEVVIAIGHTDSIGSDAYNQKLSVRRAESIKAYLTSKGVPANRIYTEGKGEKQPVASNKTKDGRAKNRRVEIEVIGTRK